MALGAPPEAQQDVPVSEDAEQFLNRLDRTDDIANLPEPEINLGPYEIPQPSPLLASDVVECMSHS